MTVFVGNDTAKTRRTLEVGGRSYAYYSIAAAEAAGLGDFSRLPAALKVVLENMLRFEDGRSVTARRHPRLCGVGDARRARTRARSPTARRAC